MDNPEIVADSRLLKRSDDGPETVYDACPFIPPGAPVAVQIGPFNAERTLERFFPDNPIIKNLGNGSYDVEVDILAEATREIAAAKKSGVFAVRTSANQIPLRNGSVDEIYALNVFGESHRIALRKVGLPLHKDQQTFAEFSRILKKDGHVVICESYTPDIAADILKDIDFAAQGWVPSLYQDERGISSALREYGAHALLAQALAQPDQWHIEHDIRGMNNLTFRKDKPIVLILTKPSLD